MAKNKNQSDDVSDVSLEEELLQVTEKKNKSKKGQKKKKVQSDEEEGEVLSASDGDSDEKKNNKRKKSSDNKKPPKKRKTEEEYKDAHSSSDESSDEEFNDGFDDELMGDEKDRQWLLSLPEIDRENILSERYERRKEMKERWMAKQRLKAEKRSSKKDRKERERRDRDKNKKKEKKGKALSELKKKRAKAYKLEVEDDDDESPQEDTKDHEDEDFAPEDHIRADRHHYDREESPRASSDHFDEDEDEGPQVTLTELNQIRLSRETLESWVDKPFFEDMVPGFFVRIGIGLDPTTHLNVYRIAQIFEVRESSQMYAMGSKQTHKLLRLRIGLKDKDFKMDTISNKGFTDSEFQRWAHEMKKSNVTIMRMKEFHRKLEQLHKAKDYTYTPEDIEKMLQAKRKMGKVPVNIAAERARLAALRDAAKETNQEEYRQICEQIRKLEELAREKSDKSGRANTVININKKNKDANFTKSYTMEVSKEEKTKNSDLDPFSRRKTLPRIIFTTTKEQPATPPFDTTSPVNNNNNNNNNSSNNNNDDNSSESKNKKEDNNQSGAETSKSLFLRSSSSSLSSSSENLDPAKVLQSAHDFDFDITPIPVNTAPLLPLQATVPISVSTPTPPTFNSDYTSTFNLNTNLDSTPAPSSTSKSTLSLADYMRRRRMLE